MHPVYKRGMNLVPATFYFWYGFPLPLAEVGVRSQ
jgi:hypothetical protein